MAFARNRLVERTPHGYVLSFVLDNEGVDFGYELVVVDLHVQVDRKSWTLAEHVLQQGYATRFVRVVDYSSVYAVGDQRCAHYSLQLFY